MRQRIVLQLINAVPPRLARGSARVAPLGRDDRLPLLAEIRVAVNSPDTFANFGAKGYPIFAAVRLGTCQSWRRTSGWIAKPVGALVTPGRGKMYLRAPVYIAETDWQARDEPVATAPAPVRGNTCRPHL